jgi:hypothetical protein
MNIVQIDNWRDYRRDGEQFLHTATEAHNKKRKAFSTDTLYNVTCMAIEKLVMAFLMKNGDLAEKSNNGRYSQGIAAPSWRYPRFGGKAYVFRYIPGDMLPR